MTNFNLKFIDGSPVSEEYATQLFAFNRAVNKCDITEDDELAMGLYWTNEPEEPEDDPATPTCTHPPNRVYAWFATDGTFCAGCCDCGQVLAGAAKPSEARPLTE
jgi:hypothetical protein